MTLLTGISISWKPCRQWLPGQLLASAVFYELFIQLMLRISHYFTFPAILTIKLCHCHFHLPGGSQPLPAVGYSALQYVKQIFTAVSAHLGHNLHPRQAWEKHLLNWKMTFHTDKLHFSLLLLLHPRDCPVYFLVQPRPFLLLHLVLQSMLTSGSVHTWSLVPSWRIVCQCALL